MLDFSGKVAVVTGGGSGIGRAIATRLAAQRGRVAVLDVNGDAAGEVARETGGLGVPCDVTDPAAVRGAVVAVERTLGPIDVLVNNAGWDRVEPFTKGDAATWDRLLAVNLRGPIEVTRAVLDGMLERRRGRICFLASDAGRVGSSGEAVYSAAKGGVIAFSKTLAREVARAGISVNCVSPGPTDTPLARAVLEANPKFMAALERLIPFGRLGRPEEVAAAVVFLVSDEASYITGQTLSVNGGLNML